RKSQNTWRSPCPLKDGWEHPRSCDRPKKRRSRSGHSQRRLRYTERGGRNEDCLSVTCVPRNSSKIQMDPLLSCLPSQLLLRDSGLRGMWNETEAKVYRKTTGSNAREDLTIFPRSQHRRRHSSRKIKKVKRRVPSPSSKTVPKKFGTLNFGTSLVLEVKFCTIR